MEVLIKSSQFAFADDAFAVASAKEGIGFIFDKGNRCIPFLYFSNSYISVCCMGDHTMQQNSSLLLTNSPGYVLNNIIMGSLLHVQNVLNSITITALLEFTILSI